MCFRVDARENGEEEDFDEKDVHEASGMSNLEVRHCICGYF